MKLKTAFFTLVTLAGASVTLSSQTFSIVLAPGTIKDISGSTLTHASQTSQGLNFFFAETASSVADLQGLFASPTAPTPDEFSSLDSLTWNTLPATTASGNEFWATPNFLSNDKLTSTVEGGRLVVGVFEASTVGEIVAGSQVGLLASTNVVPDLGNIDYNFNSFEIVVGESGSLQTVNAVPEPSAFALLAGCFGLAWVMVRRRA